MRIVASLLTFVFSLALFAQADSKLGPAVCVSAVADSTSKVVGLANWNGDLASEITRRRKPLQGVALPAGANGRAVAHDENCDYLLEVTVHVGASTSVALNPPRPNPQNPTLDPNRLGSQWLVRATYRLTAVRDSSTAIDIEDSIAEEYEPNVLGPGRDLPSVAHRLAQISAHNAAGRLKKKLKL